MSVIVKSVTTRDLRFPLSDGHGTDAVHSNPVYSYAVADIHLDDGTTGVGFSFTLGLGNKLVCQAIDSLAPLIVGETLTALVSQAGSLQNRLKNHDQLRWLGPHKGVVHLALAALMNGIFDAWARSIGKPLWQALTDLSAEQIVDLVDFADLEDELTKADALQLLLECEATKDDRRNVVESGYPAYDTSVGWFGYSDQILIEKVERAIERGFNAVKLKVGSRDTQRDIARLELLRKRFGDTLNIMIDANQQWSYSTAKSVCRDISSLDPFWIEEPLHPDDVVGHGRLQAEIDPLKIAAGEHVANSVAFKNYFQLRGFQYCQVDCTRVAGVSEFICVSLLASKHGIPVIPHVGDMGQVHQHLVVFNHVSLDIPKLYLEYIPHLKDFFEEPADVRDGRYVIPRSSGSSASFSTDVAHGSDN